MKDEFRELEVKIASLEARFQSNIKDHWSMLRDLVEELRRLQDGKGD